MTGAIGAAAGRAVPAHTTGFSGEKRRMVSSESVMDLCMPDRARCNHAPGAAPSQARAGGSRTVLVGAIPQKRGPCALRRAGSYGVWQYPIKQPIVRRSR